MSNHVARQPSAETATESELIQCALARDPLALRLIMLPIVASLAYEVIRLAGVYRHVKWIQTLPAYGDPADAVAADIVARAHPGRNVVPVPCRPLIWQNGSLHCMTMQMPEGSLV